jgi:uncharacterized damage-inducible protein DinB
MTLGGMLKHLAYVEDVWFSRFLYDRAPEPPWDRVERRPPPSPSLESAT